MRNVSGKIASLALSLVLATGLCPAAALAADARPDTQPGLTVGAIRTQQQLAPQSSTTPTSSSNLNGHEYGFNTANPACSFLHVNGGALERVEFANGKLIVETIATNYRSATSKKTIAASTYQPSNLAKGNECLWGGFYSGASHNYVVTGQANSGENDALAVFRITKYAKDWSYVASAELKGANTSLPFRAGSCDMVESGGKLYIRTCHQMYTSSDGLRHQANVHIVVDESNMAITDSFTGVMNIGISSGYVSHSFNQFLTTLADSVYGFDHGDAYPRSAVIKQLGGGYTDVISFGGDIGDNATGATLGGFESSSTRGNLLTAGTQTYDKSLSGAQANVWVGVTPKGLSATSITHLTSYGASSTETAGNPFLVKVNEDKFLVIWSVREWSGSSWDNNGTGTIRYQFVDGAGSKIGSLHTVQGMLSDCQPVLYNGSVVWYAADGGQPSFYSVNASTGAFAKVETLASATIECEQLEYSWYDWRTGNYVKALPFQKAQSCPEVAVSLGGRTLKKGTDYALSYSLNAAKSTGTITVKGLGALAGSVKSLTFDVIPYLLSEWNMQLAASKKYTGKALKPTPVVTVNGKKLKAGTNFTVSYANNVNAGTAQAIVKGKGVYGGSATLTFQIAKAANPLKVKATTKTVKLAKGKKALSKKKVVAGAIKLTAKGKGKLTYTRVARGSSKQLTIAKKTGKITVKKGTKRGTYKIKVKVKAAGNANYKATSKTVTAKVRVK